VHNTRAKIIICTFLIVATFYIYSQVQDHKFINFDDDLYITNNLNVQAGLTSESVIWAFTTFATGNWLPLTWLSYMLDYQLYGAHPKGYLLTNLFLHITSALILFIVLLRMTGALWQSAFVAAMFAFHPLSVESVAWAAERKNVLSTLFWLLTMWAYIHYAAKPTLKSYGLVFLFFTLGLLSKSMLVTLPFVLLLLDYWPLRRFKFAQERDNNEISGKNTAQRSETLRLVLEKLPLFLLTAGFGIVTYIAQKSFGSMHYTESLTFSTRLTNATVSYFDYLGKMVWPSGLSILYPHPGNTLPDWQGILCGMALVGITVVSTRLIKKEPYVAVGWFWYLGTLVPVIGIVQVGGVAMADRYAYIPLIGIFILVAWGVPELLSKWRYKKKVLSVSAGIIIVTLLITTWKQTSHWKNSITLYKHAIRVTDKKHPNFSLVHNNLGIALFTEGKNEEAIYHYKMAIKIKPVQSLVHYNLGVALVDEGKNKEAISQYKMAIRLNPNFTNAHYNLGIILLQKGALKEAAYHFRETVRLRPDLVEAGDYLKYALLQSQELE
jgi:hypothetical protein